MPNQTIYDIRLRYLLDDKTGKGLGAIADNAARAARGTSALSSMLGRVGTYVVGAFGVRAAGRALIGFNDDLEQAKITMAGMLELNLGGKWADNMGKASQLVGDFQQIAKASVGTTKDFVDMAQLITRPVTAAGGSMNDLKDATAGAVIAARAFNIEAEVASRDIESALQGTLTAKDRFARALLEPMGFDVAKWNALDPTKRLENLIKAFNSPAIKDMAKAQENSFSGVLSTFQDNLQMAIGKVGLPLFKALTAEVKSWNAWLDANQDKVAEFGKVLADGLVTGFTTVKDAIAFLIDHKDTLIMIGKIWLAAKGASMLGELGGKLGGLMKAARSPISGVGGAMGAIGGNLGAVAGAGLVGWQVGTWLRQSAIGDEMAKLVGTFDYTNEYLENRSRAIAHSLGVLNRTVEDAAKRLEESTGKKPTYIQGAMTGATDLAASRANVLRDLARMQETDFQGYIQKVASMMMAGGDHWDVADVLPRGVSLGQAGPDMLRKLADEQDAIVSTVEDRLKVAEAATNFYLSNAMMRLDSTQQQQLDVDKATNQIMTMLAAEYSKTGKLIVGDADRWAKIMEIIMGALPGGADGQAARGKPKVNTKPKVNVTIQRIEVQSNDPDRFAFGLVEAFRDAAKNPSAATDVLREG